MHSCAFLGAVFWLSVDLGFTLYEKPSPKVSASCQSHRRQTDALNPSSRHRADPKKSQTPQAANTDKTNGSSCLIR